LTNNLSQNNINCRLKKYFGGRIVANIVYCACSIDGFIAKNDGNIDWLLNIPNEENSDYGFSELMKRIDGIIMGRNTFEKILEMNLNEWQYTKPVFVLSSKLKEMPNELKGKAEIINDGIENILEKLRNRNMDNFYIDGGKTIQSFLKKDLIDEMIISTIPIILGDGIPLFGKINKEIKFRHKKVEYINEYIAINYYEKLLNKKLENGTTAYNRTVTVRPLEAG
jgi:dihydrofolate reductase